MRKFSSVIVSILMAMQIGCALFVPKETAYLRSALDRATGDEVRQHLGEPRSTKNTQNGEAQWLYEIRELEPGSQSSWSAAGSWCDEYRLTFDQQGILRHWTHHSYFHGGEVMPLSCNTSLGVEKPAL